MKKDFKYREIPYNYTSFSDKEIVLRYFDTEMWEILNTLRDQRVTGRSAKLFFEILGDIFIIDRNPYIFNDFLENKKKQTKLKKLHKIRLQAIERGANNDLVFKLIEKAKEADKKFFSKFSIENQRRKKISYVLDEITPKNNIFFSPFHKVSHVTDATDWRVEYPEVVVYPESIQEIIGLVKAAKNLNLKIIPRGGGTGLTGGAIPVYQNTMVINCEKLRGFKEIEIVHENNIDIPLIDVEAGVITENITHYCKEKGYIFATDPTSAWASTIGGNIAENCGGKKAVIWGTAIDNLYSFRIVNAQGKLIEIKRRNHPYRKILPEDEVIFDIYQLHRRKKEQLLKSVILKGTDIRKLGIGKDITNKVLGGVPGLQKEGGDGIIVSAKFILYKPFNFIRTICLEFFGKNLVNASKAIVDIKNSFEKHGSVYLTALEHFDEKYVVAIKYRNKSNKSEIPKAILLVDIESNNESDLIAASDSILEMVKGYDTEAFIAVDEEAREFFWKDRKNLGAIARHTNAFKLNEDIVIPIEALPEFSDFIDKLNIKKELENNLNILSGVNGFLVKLVPNGDEFLSSKIKSYLQESDKIYAAYKMIAENIYDNSDFFDELSKPGCHEDGKISLNIEKDVINQFSLIFHGYDEIIDGFNEIVKDIQTKKIIIATHMHAGDGNVHVNIPVHSNDYLMLQEANETAGIIMKKAIDFGGVISGEHGIGLTKLQFIDQDILDEYAKYKKQNDPDDLFNPGKLTSNFPTSSIYTPSLNLLEMEAFILESTDLKQLTMAISACVRCGKCKEVCNTNYPQGTMFFNPRNKILGVSLITEAVLYEAQTENTLGFRNFTMLRDISDHCTMCHNCYKPCPVNIDFGEVTLSIRDLLVERKRSKFKMITSFSLYYVRKRGYYINKFFRYILLKIGYSSQRIAYYINKPFSKITGLLLPKVNSILKSRLPKSGNPSIREILGLKGTNTFFAFYDPEKPVKKSVIYFPGCGSERMYPEISIATIALLYYAGIRVVLLPEYLCCGYPLLANGKVKQADIKSNENRVILHRIASSIGYMGIEDIIISCGTCMEMIKKYQVENIFLNSSLIDINEFIVKEHLYKIDKKDEVLLYHDPCHTPLKINGAIKTFQSLFNTTPKIIPNCCGEGGTLALSTPEIANILRDRKIDNIHKHVNKHEKAVVLTTCPSCVQGLSRTNSSITGKSLVVYLAEELYGKNWKKKFIKDVKKDDGFDRIIL